MINVVIISLDNNLYILLKKNVLTICKVFNLLQYCLSVCINSEREIMRISKVFNFLQYRSKQFDTLVMFLKEIFEKVNF